MLRFNYAVIQHQDLIYEWRNHESVRATALDSSPLDYDAHVKWFTNVLQNPNKHLLMIELQHRPVGVIRLDVDGAQAVISIYLDPSLTGKGIGTRALTQIDDWIRDNLTTVQQIHATVLAKNSKSQHAFVKSGYQIDASVQDSDKEINYAKDLY